MRFASSGSQPIERPETSPFLISAHGVVDERDPLRDLRADLDAFGGDGRGEDVPERLIGAVLPEERQGQRELRAHRFHDVALAIGLRRRRDPFEDPLLVVEAFQVEEGIRVFHARIACGRVRGADYLFFN